MRNGIIPQSWSGPLHAALRIMAGLLFLQHGTAKLFGFPAVDMFKDGVSGLMLFAALIEIAGGILIIVGAFTRVTAFVLAGFMAVAYFMAHAPQGFFPILNMGELAILFCFVFLWLAASGAGPYSVDGASSNA
jgi:putative oxidoreductase